MSLKELFDEANSMESNDALEEIEYIFFLKLEDFDQLKNAKSKEFQEQWSVLFKDDRGLLENVVRVRHTTSTEDDRYVLTSKVNIASLDGKWELEQPVERFHFDELKQVAKEGLIKERYFFPVDGTDLTFEVDVFYNNEGVPFEWVKVDLEVERRLGKLPDLPITYVEAILEQPEEYSEKQKTFVRNLFRNHYTVSVN